MFPLDFFIFLQIILFLFITPGLPRVIIVSHTINYGLNRSVWTALGDISANFCQGILVVFVIGSLLKDNPEALNLLKWAGILYILYLAYDTFTARLRSIDKKTKKFKTRFSFYKDGFLVAGLSPKAIVFFGTIFTYVTLDFLTLMIYGLAAEKIAKWLKGNPKLLNTISACVLVIIALFIAVTQKF